MENKQETINLHNFLNYILFKCVENNKTKLMIYEDKTNCNDDLIERLIIKFSIEKNIIYSSIYELKEIESTIKDLIPKIKVNYIILMLV